MKSSNHKLLNDAYTLHLIITILLALGGFVTGIAYAIIQENGWLLLAIWLGTFVVVGLGYVLGRLFLDMLDDNKAIRDVTLKNAAVRTSAPHATNSVAVTETVADKLTQLNTLLRDGKITQEFYEKEKARILSGYSGNANNSTAAPSVAKAADNAVASSTDIAGQQKTLQLKAMLEKGAITQEEYEEKTKEYEKKMKETYTIE